MNYKVDNAIIMAAGYSSRFAPLSYEKPKALMTVRGEVLIERQIRQLQEAGIEDIILVVGYKKEAFEYLAGKYGVKIIENTEYTVRNNNSTINAVKQYLNNTYICSSDNYFMENPFETEVEEAYYAAVYAPEETKEWCMTTDNDDWITNVQIGGFGQWYMLGHVFWTEEFSKKFVEILEQVYDQPETSDMLWEKIYLQHIDELKLKIRKYPDEYIFEFDSLDELRMFDDSYKTNSGSLIMQDVAEQLGCSESEISECEPWRDETGDVIGFGFLFMERRYYYDYEGKRIIE